MPEPISGPLNTLTVTSKQGDTYSLSPVDAEARQEIDDAENLQFDEDYFTVEEDTVNRELSIGLAGVDFGVESPLKFVQDNENGVVVGIDLPDLSGYVNGTPANSPLRLSAGTNGLLISTSSTWVSATGNSAWVEGGGTTASGDFSHAEGGGTTASGNNSHSEGAGTRATAESTHAEGGGCLASNDYAHAEGRGTRAEGIASHAQGGNTIATGDYAFVAGRYNEDTTGLLVIGNGVNVSGQVTRSDCFKIDSTGKLHFLNDGTLTELNFDTTTFQTQLDGLLVEEGEPLVSEPDTVLVSRLSNNELLARRAYEDEDGNNIKTGKASSISLAPEFSPSTPYAKDEVVMHDGELRKFTSAHPAGAWSALDNKAIDILTLLKEMNTKMKTFTLFAPTGATYTLTGASEFAHFGLASDKTLDFTAVSSGSNAVVGFKAGESVKIVGAQVKAGGGFGLQTPKAGITDSSVNPTLTSAGKAAVLSVKLVELASNGTVVGNAIATYTLSVVDWNVTEDKSIVLDIPSSVTTGTSFGLSVDATGSTFELDDFNIQDSYTASGAARIITPEIVLVVETDTMAKRADGSDVE